MASLAERVAGERMARMVLSMIAEPDDQVTGHVLAQVGGVETLRLVESDDPIPRMSRGGALLWRERLAGRLDPDLPERVAEVEGQEFGTLIPADREWPTGLSDLGIRAPYVLWTRGAMSFLTSPLRERVTITGARAASDYGMEVASDLAANLATTNASSWPAAASGSRAPPIRARLPRVAIRSRSLPVVWTAPTRQLIASCWNVSAMSVCW